MSPRQRRSIWPIETSARRERAPASRRRFVVKKASITVVLAVASTLALPACAQKTEPVSTAPPPPMAAPPPPPEPYVAPPAPTRVVTHRRKHVRHVRHRRHTHTTTTTHETTTVTTTSR